METHEVVSCHDTGEDDEEASEDEDEEAGSEEAEMDADMSSGGEAASEEEDDEWEFWISAKIDGWGLIHAENPLKIMELGFESLDGIYKARRKVYATVEYVDMPNPVGSSSERSAKFPESFLAELRTTDALAHVVRVFDSPSVPHIHGDVNFTRDIKQINSDLILADLAVVENILERLERRLKTGDSSQEVTGRN